MYSKENAFYIGYVLVLIISLLYKTVCLFFPNCLFPVWSNIVVAATVATCFFCVSDILSTMSELINYKKMHYSILNERTNELSKKMNNILCNTLKQAGENVDNVEGMILLNEFKTAIEPDNTFESFTKYKEWVFGLDVAGFFSFFGIVIFEPLNKSLFPCQDVLTIIAFIIVLCSSMYKDYKINRINNEVRHKMEQQKRLMVATTVIEIHEKGQKKHG